MRIQRHFFERASAYDSVCHQQLQDGFETNALLADERHGMDFSTRIVISSHKSHGDDLARPRMFPMKGRMLLGSRLTFPLPVGAGVASDRIKVRTTAVQLAVAQYQDVDIADIRAIQEFGADFVKSVLNHDCCAQWGPCVALWKLTVLKKHRNGIKNLLCGIWRGIGVRSPILCELLRANGIPSPSVRVSSRFTLVVSKAKLKSTSG
jgi:hypothetical protein